MSRKLFLPSSQQLLQQHRKRFSIKVFHPLPEPYNLHQHTASESVQESETQKRPFPLK